MTDISAADKHSIQIRDDKWRLRYDERPLAEASAKGFRYSSHFAKNRHLPDSGIIAPHDIKQVVLGWQQRDESWHMGLILMPALAEERGSRWCELVSWPDPEVVVFQDLAQRTGQQLAQILGIGFYVIPPNPQQLGRKVSQRTLASLPLQVGDWELSQVTPDQRRLMLKRVPTWALGRVARAMWYAIWLMIYLILSIATLTSDIALPTTGTLLPNPQLLPYLGLVISVWLFFAMLYEIFVILTRVNTIVIDGIRGNIIGKHNQRTHWTIPIVEVQSVYVSEAVKRRQRPPETEYGELNVHLGGGKFRYLIQQRHPHDNAQIPQPEQALERLAGIRALNRDEIHTTLQTAAAYIAQAIGDIPIWHDLRVKR